MLKKCTCCKEEKELGCFSIYKRQEGKYNTVCKKCIVDKGRKQKQKIREYNLKNGFVDIAEKKCTKCGEVKSIENFSLSLREISGRRTQCKDCVNIQEKCRYRDLDKDNIIIPEYKICNKCKESKKIDEFTKNSFRKDLHSSTCIKCTYAVQRVRYQRDRERIIAETATYSMNNKESIKAAADIYRKSSAKFKNNANKLTIEENPIEGENGELLVKCTHCKEYFSPTNDEINRRIASLKRSSGGEGRLYCSETCKLNCSIYNAQKLPRDLRYLSNQSHRCNRKFNRQALLDLQVDEYGYNFCDECGNKIKETKFLHIHHGILASENKEDADNMAHQEIICKECHIKRHQMCK